MFHVQFLVDDKFLAPTLRDLSKYKVYELDVRPAINTKKANGKVVEEHPGTLKERVVPILKSRFSGHGKLPRAAIFEIIKEVGGIPSSDLLSRLLKDKVIKRQGRNAYVVTGD